MEKLALITDLRNADVYRMADIYKEAPEELQADKDVVIAMVSMHGSFIPNSFKDDPEVALAAVRNNGRSLEHVNPSFQDDKEIVKVAVQRVGSAISFASDRLKSDREIALLAVKNNG
eukprot:CAMPEP_0113613474 /NCGR_PEP_ID=MMETSP0017_2-20120614/6657_1 /TAXON_ID=2856 /ORGANISM="Cylindrotheca closterium" /LENGTH=116 /DNA_ID=CAMNT_0000522587 /DNA_START=105 /DNA_END=451 /DNA_ORIENTATION=- /assembly_acc=CAM_ASM_000147